ncbi:Mre11 DNA-binding presumed domain-containing protein [Aspergillus pseudoustus]|uniref:Double-strand break repair protein n=1 Tax=Aspergillus pseudoustus TaxID=1810923 RepID=A0ABR4JLG8_9EURO
MSNVRDERLFRTFRDGKVKFFRPGIQKEDWYNLICVHQNHHAYTETGYLPENFLPEFLDLVIWGHEHECLINPKINPETKFRVMQPGSSVATSLVPGEAVAKHVAILSITGREMKCEPIRLKSVRPFVMREIVLSEEKEAKKLARKENNRTEVTRFLITIVEELIEEAKADWLELHGDREDEDEELEVPLPLVRLRVETSTPEGGSFDCENPQRFSNRFVGKVANVNDVVQFYRKKKTASTRKKDNEPDEASISHLSTLDTMKVEQLVREFLAAQSLSILPQNSFGDAVSQFIDKDDKHAMEMFVNESLEGQIKHLLALDRDDSDAEDEDTQSSLQKAMEKYRTQMEDMFARGIKKRTRGKKRFKPKPDGWDTEFDGVWEDQPGALIHSDNEGGDPAEEEAGEDGTEPAGRSATATRGRGRGHGRGARAAASNTTTTRKTATTKEPTRKAATTKTATRGRGRRAASDDEGDDEDDDVVMLDDDEKPEPSNAVFEEDEVDSDSQALFVKQPARKAAASKTTSTKSATTQRTRQPKRTAASPVASNTASQTATTSRRGRGGRQTQLTLDFVGSQSQRGAVGASVGSSNTRSMRPNRTTRSVSVLSEDIDDSDGFEPMPSSNRRRR